MAFDSKAFISDVLKDASIDEAKKQAILEAASDPALAKKFQELHENGLRQDEFSRKMNEYSTALKSVNTYRSQLESWKTDYEKETEQKFKEELTRVKRQSGYLVDDNDDQDGKINADELQKRIDGIKKEQELYNQNMFVYHNALTKLGLQHMKEFGGVLDVDKLVTFANENGLNIVQAYDKFVFDDRKAISDKLFQEQLEQARQQGAQEALKNAKLPMAGVTFNNGIPHSTEAINKGTGDGKFGALAAVKAFMESNHNG